MSDLLVSMPPSESGQRGSIAASETQPADARREWGLYALCGFFLLAYYLSPHPALAVLGAAGFTALAYLRLDLALLFVLFAAPFYRFPKTFGTLEFSLVELAVLGCFAAWVFRGDWRKLLSMVSTLWGGKSSLPHARELAMYCLPALLFGLAATASLSTSEMLKVSLREYRVVVVEPMLFFVMLLTTLNGERHVWRYLNAFVALGTGMAVFGLYHYFFVGIVEQVGGVERMLAIYHSPNALGLLLGRVASATLPLAIFAMGRRSSTSADGPLHRAVYAVAALIILVCLFFTYSRGAWIGVVAALLLCAALQGRRLLLATGGLVLAAALAGAVFFWERLASWNTTFRRVYVWQSALEMWRDRPLFGVGLDNFLYFYPDYMKDEAAIEPTLSHPHNLVLDYATRLGILGVISLAWSQAVFWLAGLRLYRHASRHSVRLVALALMASMADFLVHGLVDNSYFLIDLAYVFWLTIGLLAGIIKVEDARVTVEET
ncbi:MAG: hypothetical protein EPO21_19675 [Chloroflexota bacterium]|nr:MAG: hypothetical protein EPO21_19675 [Chloroflexota bacterium]